MATSKSKKQDQLKALEAIFATAKGVAFTRFDGATVEEVQLIRRDLRSKGMSYTVIKKTLMAIAAKTQKLADFSADDLSGSVAVICSTEDSIAPAAAIKVMKNESLNKETKVSTFNFAGAIFEEKFLDEAETAVLANTPTREESLSKIVSMLKSGPQKLHGVLGSGLRGIHNVCKNADQITAS